MTDKQNEPLRFGDPNQKPDGSPRNVRRIGGSASETPERKIQKLHDAIIRIVLRGPKSYIGARNLPADRQSFERQIEALFERLNRYMGSGHTLQTTVAETRNMLSRALHRGPDEKLSLFEQCIRDLDAVFKQFHLINPESYDSELFTLIDGLVVPGSRPTQLDPSQAQDGAYNSRRCKNALAELTENIEEPQRVARTFQLSDRERGGRSYRVNVTKSVVEKLDYLQEMAAGQKFLRGTQVMEIMTFLAGNVAPNGEVNIDTLVIPPFQYDPRSPDSLTFPSSAIQSEVPPGKQIIGTYHPHPHGENWAVLSDDDVNGFIRSLFVKDESGKHNSRVHYLFNIVAPRNFVTPQGTPKWAIFPMQADAYMGDGKLLSRVWRQSEQKSRAGDRTIYPVEELRDKSIPYQDIA